MEQVLIDFNIKGLVAEMNKLRHLGFDCWLEGCGNGDIKIKMEGYIYNLKH